MKLSKVLLLAAVVLSTVACGKIPEAYRGKFQDTEKGATMELEASAGKLTLANGRVLEAKADDLSFDALAEGKSGIYVSANPADGRMMDVYWVNTNMATKQEVEGFVWYQSEVIYTLMDSKAKDKVPSIGFFHCTDGMVMLDRGAKRLQVGCPASPVTYRMIRKE